MLNCKQCLCCSRVNNEDLLMGVIFAMIEFLQLI